MTNFALYTSEYFGDDEDQLDEDQLLKHKELIIPLEALRYCKTINIDKIGYSKLRKLSNDRLFSVSKGKDTDFGGSFEHYVSKFEKEYEHIIGIFERIRDNGRTFIIPDIKKIVSLFDSMKLGDILEEKALVKDPIFIEYEDSYSPLYSVREDLPKEGKFINLIYPSGVYTARYYYKDGHPVFLQQIMPDNLVLGSSNSVDPSPFYKKTKYLYKRDNISKNETIFSSDKWNLYASMPNGSMKLSEESIRKLVKVGKEIASKDPAKPYKITIEYHGDSSSDNWI